MVFFMVIGNPILSQHTTKFYCTVWGNITCTFSETTNMLGMISMQEYHWMVLYVYRSEILK